MKTAASVSCLYVQIGLVSHGFDWSDTSGGVCIEWHRTARGLGCAVSVLLRLLSSRRQNETLCPDREERVISHHEFCTGP